MKHSTLHLHTSFTIAPVDQRIFGGFLEHLGRAVYEGVYEPTSPHADLEGCRKDVLEALKKLKFTTMRYPGGNFVSGYHWQDAIGPKDQRPVTRDLAWQTLESNQFGTDEFVSLCKKLDWDPMLAVNLGTGTPEEARNWLEYCNCEAGSKYSDMRVANGHKEPHNVKLWCLGNEMDGDWQLGHVPAETYAVNAAQTARMMRMCDPSVELIVCGSCGDGMASYLEWDRVILEHCKDTIDHISIHRYVGNRNDDTADFLAVTNSVDAQIEATAALCHMVQARKKTKKRITISFDEWNVWYRWVGEDAMMGKGKFAPHLLEEVYNLEDALVVAGFLNSFIRHADTVKLANLAQIVNVIAPILTRGDEMLIQSIFYPIAAMAARGTGVALQSHIEGETYSTQSYGEAGYLDQSAILDGNKLHICLVNRSLSEEHEVTLNLTGASLASLESAEIITGPDAKAANSFENQQVVTSKPFADFSFQGGKAIVKLPPLSVCSATLDLS